MTARPRIEIRYCTQCRWLLRAAWMAQELLTTFQEEAGEVALVPATGGILEVRVEGELVWSRKEAGRFPEMAELKQLVRDRIAPDKPLGHSDGKGREERNVSVKDQLLNEAAREYQALREALKGLSEAQLTQVWLGSWSIKEIVAHMSGWHREMGPALERLARGERPLPAGVSYEDVDAWNAKFTAAQKGTAVADLLRELEKSHEYFLSAAAKVPDERFQPDKTAYKIVNLNSAHHYKHHGDQIRSWRHAQGGGRE